MVANVKLFTLHSKDNILCDLLSFFLPFCRTIWSRDEAFEDRKDRDDSARKNFTFVNLQVLLTPI